MKLRKNLLMILFVTFGSLFLLSPSNGEIIHLKDGRTLEGQVIRNNSTVTIIAPGGVFQFPESDLFRKEEWKTNSVTATDLTTMPTTVMSDSKKEKPMSEPNPVVQIETTLGTFKVELFEDDCPNTTANFIHIAEKGMYDGALFHRVIKDFVIQGGDPGTKSGPPALWGTGGPGWQIKCELGPHKHERGVLSMAHAGKNTGGSQFFVVLQRSHTAHLDGMHTVFGKVIEGMDTIAAIEKTPLGPGDRPVTKVAMTKVTVISKRNHEYIPVKN
jgi:peptidyl-prolyl cis-trans isomerase B (cyclophilin B)